MSAIIKCGTCCMLFSVWGAVQLCFMGGFYYGESVVLLEDCEAEEYDDYDDFIAKTKSNYHAVAVNCWIAMAIYLLTFVISYLCVYRARKKVKLEASKLENDEYACAPKGAFLTEKQKEKLKVKQIKKERKMSRTVM